MRILCVNERQKAYFRIFLKFLLNVRFSQKFCVNTQLKCIFRCLLFDFFHADLTFPCLQFEFNL